MTLPLHLSIEGRRVAVVGGGPVATRKTRGLLEAGGDVVVISPSITPDLRHWAEAGTLLWVPRSFRSGDLKGAWLVYAATGVSQVDCQVEAEAAAGQTFCVRTDCASAGSARSAAVLRRGDLVIGVSHTGRADPRRAVAVRNGIADVIDARLLPLRRYRLLVS